MFTVILLHVTLLDNSWIKSQDIRRKRKLQRKLLLQLIAKLKREISDI